jgi:hypothetical protein
MWPGVSADDCGGDGPVKAPYPALAGPLPCPNEKPETMAKPPTGAHTMSGRVSFPLGTLRGERSGAVGFLSPAGPRRRAPSLDDGRHSGASVSQSGGRSTEVTVSDPPRRVEVGQRVHRSGGGSGRAARCRTLRPAARTRLPSPRLRVGGFLPMRKAMIVSAPPMPCSL